MAVRIEPHAEPIPGYKLLDRLGSGGYGEVWRAEAPGGIFKAVKIIHGDLRSTDNDLVRYAEQELKSLKRVKQVRHPYLLALDRYDIIDGRLMIVMELADCNLWDRFRECREAGLAGIPRDELLQYLAEAAEVLDLFDERFQLQHLDIKPQNLFLLHTHVKVADFGQVKDLQGLLAQVTGGITPVYAAPETFDGVVTRYCDQYSLACVYQELLTGVRAFDGCSGNQLLMQHLNMPPNLDPSPAADRPALARALAKNPEGRWPTVSAFVRAIRNGAPASVRVGGPAPRATPEDHPTPPAPMPVALSPGPAPAANTDTPLPPPQRVTETTGPAFVPAPPETPGPGPLRPALVIGLGQAGLRVLQRLRFELTERYGPPEATPAVRTLYVDTDPDALDAATRGRPGDRLAGLHPDDVFAAKLNRAAHYLKPRLNGRSLTEGWFDPQLLYKLPRAPQTLGLRVFGRLAFCDHYRPLVAKIQAELDAALSPDALATTEARTGLDRRTNRPRVYVVAGLGGGTGGGMYLDAAYVVRDRLRRMGYDDPEVLGVLIAPPADPGVCPPQVMGNTYAALTELSHYSRPGTMFAANYDDRNAAVRDRAAPFTHCYLVPGTATGPGPSAGTTPAPTRSRTPAIPVPGSRTRPAAEAAESDAAGSAFQPHAAAAELIRLGLFTPLGRAADEVRAARVAEAEDRPSGATLATFGTAGFGWPRAEVVARTAAQVARDVLRRWAAPDPTRARGVIPGVAQATWARLGLAPDAVLGQLTRAADLAAGARIEEQISLAADALAPRGWLGRLPNPEAAALALDRLTKLLGPPASPAKRPPTPVEQAVAAAAVAAAAGFVRDVRALVPGLVDDPQFRLAGAEEVLRQFLATIDRLTEQFLTSAAGLDKTAQAGFECVSQFAHFQKGMRKPATAEFAEAVRQYPRARFRALTLRTLVDVYQTTRDALTAQLAEVASARQRLEAAAARLDSPDGREPASGAHQFLPAGCVTVGDAVIRFLAVVTDADMAEIDRRAQAALEAAAGGVLRASVSSAHGPGWVVGAVGEVARAHLDVRLGEVDLAGMFAEHYRTPQQAERVVGEAYQEAEPAGVGEGPWAAAEVAVVGCPAGAGGEPLRELARRTIPVAGLPTADLRDDFVVYREWPVVPLAALPQLGPAAAAAYRILPDTQQCTAHSRLDVTAWQRADEG